MLQHTSVRRFALAGFLATMAFAPQFALADTLGTITAAYQKMLKARFRAETTTTDEKGKVTLSKSEMDTIERIHVTADKSEFIMLPEGMWMKSGGQWSKPPIDMSGMVKRFLPMGEEAMHNAKNVTDDGAAVWNGQPAHAYSMDTEVSVMGIHATSHTKLYLNAAGQVIGSESDGAAMGHKTHSVQNVTYDDSIRVTAPQ